MNLKLTVLAAAMAFACSPGLALADATRMPTFLSSTGKPVDSQPVTAVGYDSVTNLPCLVGVTPTCRGGGSATPGSTGTDYSANKPTLPNVGANFAASGPYASYVLIATVPASPTRSCPHIENNSGAQVAVVTDDGTAANAAAPANAGVFALAGGSGVGSQGGSLDPSFCAFKGRLQVYAPSSAAQAYVQVW